MSVRETQTRFIADWSNSRTQEFESCSIWAEHISAAIMPHIPSYGGEERREGGV